MDQQEWTIMIYMAGDNNLSVDMSYAMQQIKELAGEDTSSINLFVYYDGYSSEIPTLYCDFSNCRHPKQIRSYMVEDKLYPVEPRHNENAADFRSVLNFVDWCVNKVECDEHGEIARGRKADRYAMIFSGHSMGFQDIGLFKDENADTTMSMAALKGLLERITKSEAELIAEAGSDLSEEEYRQATTEILGKKIDILGFDSCVMGMLEVGNQFSSVAKTMIASEGSVPSAGWTYGKILGNLTHNSNNLPAREIAANFVSEFVRSQDSYTIGGIAVDMAAWDMSRLSELNDAFEKLASLLLDCFSEPEGTIYRQMERVLLQVHWKCQTYMYEQNVDLGDFCELLKNECSSLRKEIGGNAVAKLEELESACEAVLKELKNCIVLSGFSGGTYQFSNGISLFLPWTRAAYDVSLENYSSLTFVEQTGAGQKWNAFLDRYLRDVTFRRSPGPTALGSEPHGMSLEGASQSVEPDVTAYRQTESKLRYYSYKYSDEVRVSTGNGHSHVEGTKMPGHEGTKMPGQAGTKMPGQAGTKMPGQAGTKMPGQAGTKMPGQAGTKMPGQAGTKMPGQAGTKMPGHEGTKMPGQAGTKMPGQAGTKMPGQAGTKMPGQAGTKMPGQAGTKMPGQAGTKLAGSGGSDKFFSTFRHFKNIETPWNISGFTKEPKKLVDELQAKKTSG